LTLGMSRAPWEYFTRAGVVKCRDAVILRSAMRSRRTRPPGSSVLSPV